MKPGEVTHIPVANLEPNPHNPRRLFDEEPMRILQESIEQVGVLVPITVYPMHACMRCTKRCGVTQEP